MKSTLFGTPTLNSLKQTLDTSSLRQRVTAHNLSNVETEGFVPHRVEFRQELQKALKTPNVSLARTNAAHLRPVVPPPPIQSMKVVPAPGAGIEDFLVDLVEITYMYQASAKLLAGQYGGLHVSIRGRAS